MFGYLHTLCSSSLQLQKEDRGFVKAYLDRDIFPIPGASEDFPKRALTQKGTKLNVIKWLL